MSPRATLAAAVALALLLPAAGARAQQAGAGQGVSPSLESELTALRVSHRHERRREGFALFGGGIAATAAGLALLAKPRDETYVAASTTSIGFGVINVLLSLGRLDFGEHALREARSGRLGDHTGFEAVRDEAAKRELRGGQIFAVNAGLDVFYIAAGVLAYYFGREKDPDIDWLQGTALATVANGVYLLAFDLVAWIRSNHRADELLSLGR